MGSSVGDETGSGVGVGAGEAEADALGEGLSDGLGDAGSDPLHAASTPVAAIARTERRRGRIMEGA